MFLCISVFCFVLKINFNTFFPHVFLIRFVKLNFSCLISFRRLIRVEISSLYFSINTYNTYILLIFTPLKYFPFFNFVFVCCSQVMLSACSTYFDSIFSQYEESNPIVILKDVKFSDLKALVQFMYKGEINVDNVSIRALRSFLDVILTMRIPLFLYFY